MHEFGTGRFTAALRLYKHELYENKRVKILSAKNQFSSEANQKVIAKISILGAAASLIHRPIHRTFSVV